MKCFNSKKIIHIVTKLKNSNCGKTQKLKLWQNLKTQIVKKKLIAQTVTKETKIKLWQKSTTKIVTKLKG